MAEFGETLSKRELDVVECASRGLSNKEIAAELSISENTVKVHMRRIFAKLGAASRTEAATLAIQQGYIRVPGQTAVVETPSSTLVAAATPVEAEVATNGVPMATETTVVVDGGAPVPTAKPASLWLRVGGVLLFVVLIIGIGYMVTIGNRTGTQLVVPYAETAVGESRWYTINRPLPAGRASMAVAAIGLDLYQIGGETVDGVEGRVDIYDTIQRVWREASSKPTAVADTTAAVLFGEIYVPGGRLADGQPTDAVEVYSPSNDTWRPVTPLPQAISGGLALSDGAFLYFFGGWDGSDYLDTVYVYDAGSERWQSLTPMKQARAYAAGGFLTRRMMVVGGIDESGPLATCEIYDSDGDVWTDCPDMLRARGGLGTAVLLNKLYVFGGSGIKGRTFSEFYDPNSETWQVIEAPEQIVVSKASNMGVATVESQIYVFGGRVQESWLDESFIYKPLVFQTFIPAANR